MSKQHERTYHNTASILFVLIHCLNEFVFQFSYPGGKFFSIHFKVALRSMKHPKLPACAFLIFYVYMVRHFIANFYRLEIKLPALYDLIKQVAHFRNFEWVEVTNSVAT